MKSLIDIYETAENANIAVDCCDFLRVESMSYMDDDGDCYIAIDPFKLASEQDEKIKLAHELGHCLCGAFYNAYSPLDVREIHEAKADRWAFKQLVPFEDLMNAATSGYVEIWELAEYFDVPESMMRKAIEYYQAGNR